MPNPLYIEHVVPKNNRGGYTVVAEDVGNEKFHITICQCNPKQLYDAAKGERIAKDRLRSGKWFVQTTEQAIQTLQTLKEKVDAQ